MLPRSRMRRLARYVFYALSGGLMVLFLVGYAARYVHPAYAWWAELVAIGLPYISLALAASALGAALLRNGRLLGAHAVLLVLIAVRFGLPLPLQSEETQAGDLRVLTYNVRPWGGPPRQVKARRMQALVKQMTPNLISLQEAQTVFDGSGLQADGTRQYVSTLVKPPFGYHLAHAQEDGHTEQPVLGHVPLFELSQKTVRVGKHKEDVTYVVRVAFSWKGRRAVLYNVHLRSFGSDKPWQRKDPHLFDLGFWKHYLRQYRNAYRARAREVKRIRKMLDAETRPVLVMGDFNSTPHSWAYRQLAKNMQDAFHLAGSGWGSTYHAKLPFARIDFILASNEWKVVSARVPDADLSDHRPLFAVLRWKE